MENKNVNPKLKSLLMNLEKFLSRKLVVWIVSTVFLAIGDIDAEQWFGITMTYLGVEGGADMVTRFKNKKAQNEMQAESEAGDKKGG